PEFKINIQAQTSENITEKNQDTLFTSEMYAQLETVFSKMEKNLILKLYLDKRPVSQELKNYMESLASITDKLKVEIQKDNIENMPCVKICFSDGKETGLAFHGVPGGHEFTAFILGIYNVSCEGQKIDDELKRKITEIKNPTDIKIMVSLSCGVCPELVTAAQKIASENDFIKAEVFDLNHFPEMKQKYDVMSVPCMIINDSIPLFGKKNIKQIVNILSD
ncbi:MAG: thioredoxin family protein, partial [Ruminococcus sp.]|nr:thioredoxin family protein [Ruminococcus sp.]